MKKEFKLLLFGLSIISIAACNKERQSNAPLPPPTPGPNGISVVNKEYFWAKKWQKTLPGYEIILNPAMLSDSATPTE